MTQHNEVNIARFYQFSQKYFDLLYLFDDFYLNSFSENEENNPCGFVENY